MSQIIIGRIDHMDAPKRVILCNFCGDACDEAICLSCEETMDEMGVDPEEAIF